MRPVVPYTLALSVALLVGGISDSSGLQRHCPGRPVASLASYSGWLFVLVALLSFSNLKYYSRKKDPNYQEYTKYDSLLSMLSLAQETID